MPCQLAVWKGRSEGLEVLPFISDTWVCRMKFQPEPGMLSAIFLQRSCSDYFATTKPNTTKPNSFLHEIAVRALCKKRSLRALPRLTLLLQPPLHLWPPPVLQLPVHVREQRLVASQSCTQVQHSRPGAQISGGRKWGGAGGEGQDLGTCEGRHLLNQSAEQRF